MVIGLSLYSRIVWLKFLHPEWNAAGAIAARRAGDRHIRREVRRSHE